MPDEVEYFIYWAGCERLDLVHQPSLKDALYQAAVMRSWGLDPRVAARKKNAEG